MLLFLVPVVGQNFPQLIVFARIDSLLVPVDGPEFFDQ